METPTFKSTFPTDKENADGAISKAAASSHGAVDKLAASADEAVRAVKPAIARVAQIAHQTVDKVTDIANPTADWLTKQSENLASTSRNAVADAKTYVSFHPWQSIGVALAVGFLIGRRSR